MLQDPAQNLTTTPIFHTRYLVGSCTTSRNGTSFSYQVSGRDLHDLDRDLSTDYLDRDLSIDCSDRSLSIDYSDRALSINYLDRDLSIDYYDRDLSTDYLDRDLPTDDSMHR